MMADFSGQTTSPLMDDLLQSGHEFSFVQVMRLARRFFGPLGKEALPDIPWQSRVQVRPELSLAFPASDVTQVERDVGNLMVTATFLGLYGSSSPLPNFYSEDLLDEAANDESVIRDFIDIIHQRLYGLYFQCWSKYRLLVSIIEENNSLARDRLFCLIGLGEKELRKAVADPWSLLRYAGLLSQSPRSALGLKILLRDAMKIKTIKVIQNLKRMVPIPAEQQMRMGVSGCRLGVDTVMGCELADLMGKFRIQIGPLKWDSYNDLVPGTTQHNTLVNYAWFYLNDPLCFDLKLILASGEAKPVGLGDPKRQLGLNTWCFSGTSYGEVSASFPCARSKDEQAGRPDPQSFRTAVDSIRSLRDYYREERAHLGELLEKFARRHANLASMVSGTMADQGVKRLLEGTAFYNALLQQKLDDDFPEFIHEMTNALHPWNLRPVPATTIVTFTPKPGLANPIVIHAGAEVQSFPIQGVKCRFRTCFDVTVHPLKIVKASFAHPSGNAAFIKLRCELDGLGLSSWKAGSLRIFLGDDYPKACDLYLLLMRYLKRITITSCDSGSNVEIAPDFLKPVDFTPSEYLLSDETCFNSGHLLLQEYFLFRDKFLFLDLTGLEACCSLGSCTQFDINFELLDCPLAIPSVNEKSFVLFATPVANLFKHKAKPVSFTSEIQRHALQPIGEHPDHYQIYSVDKVEGLVKKSAAKISYGLQNSPLHQKKADHYCRIDQRQASIGAGFATYISIPRHEPENRSARIKLDVELTCTNGMLPERLSIGDVCLATVSIPESVEPKNITAMTAAMCHDDQRNRQWRLLSVFSLNSASLATARNLRAVLRLMSASSGRNPVCTIAANRKIDAIEDVEAKPNDRLIGRTMYRGYDIRLKLRSDGFAGLGEMYLFSSVIERFLGGYVTQNCFVRLVVEEIDTGYRFEWPARMGDRNVV